MTKIISIRSSLHRWSSYLVVLTAMMVGIALARLPLPLAAGVLLAIAVILLTIIQPLFGLALALLAAPFGALEQVLFGYSVIDSGQFLLLLTLAAWLGRALVSRNIFIPKTRLNIPFLLLLSTALITTINAASVVTAIRETIKWLEMALTMLLVVSLASEKAPPSLAKQDHPATSRAPYLVAIVGMLLLTGAGQALIGIWQFALRGDGPEHFLVLGRYFRAYGSFEQPNPFGGFMNLSALLAIGVLVGLLTMWMNWLRDGRKLPADPARSNWRSLLLTLSVLFVAAVTSVALLFSWSRGAWLGFVAGAVTILLFWPRRRVVGILILVIILLVALTGLQLGTIPLPVTARLTDFADDFSAGDVRGKDINDTNYSILERQAHWQAGLDMLRENLWLGVGFGNYADAYPQYALINWPDPLGHAHNYYINIAAESGVLGLIVYLLFWGAVVWQTIRLLTHLSWPDRGIGLGLLAIWVAVSVHHLVDKLYVNNIYINLGVLFGLLQLLEQERKSANRAFIA